MTTGNFVPWMNLLHIGFKMELFDEKTGRVIGEAIPGSFLYDSRTDSIRLIDTSKPGTCLPEELDNEEEED